MLSPQHQGEGTFTLTVIQLSRFTPCHSSLSIYTLDNDKHTFKVNESHTNQWSRPQAKAFDETAKSIAAGKFNRWAAESPMKVVYLGYLSDQINYQE